MPPPSQGRRPFTTSSLTSTLRSTIASQPILGNTIDKLSSQANSFAQKSSIFGALNQQFQQINQQHSQQQPQQRQNQTVGHSLDCANDQAKNSPIDLAGGGTASIQQQPPHPTSSSNNTHSSANNNTFNNNNSNNIANSSKAETMTTPTVDMSHLTEEERLMIQSVMAKAEMADMGMPVDTSMPSSTNLPSQTSQALTQQRSQQQQQQRQQQQLNLQRQMFNNNNNNNFNQQQQRPFNQNSDFAANQQSQQQNFAQQPQQSFQQANLNQSQPQTNAQQHQQQHHLGPNMSITNSNPQQQQHQPMSMTHNNNIGVIPNNPALQQVDTFGQQQAQFNNQNQIPPQQQQQANQQAFAQQQPQQQQQPMQTHLGSAIQNSSSNFGQNLANQPHQQQQQQQQQLSSNQISSVLDQFMPPQIANQQQRQQQTQNQQAILANEFDGRGIAQPASFDLNNPISQQQQQQAMNLQQAQQQPSFVLKQPQSTSIQQRDDLNSLQLQQQGLIMQDLGSEDQRSPFGVTDNQQLLPGQNMLDSMQVQLQQQQQQQLQPQISQTYDMMQISQQDYINRSQQVPSQTAKLQHHHNQLDKHQQQQQPLPQLPMSSYQHQLPMVNDYSQPSGMLRADAYVNDQEHAYSDQELHGGSIARGRRRRDDRMAPKQQMSLEVSSSDWQQNRKHQQLLRNPSGRAMQAYDLASTNASITQQHDNSPRSSPFGSRPHKSRKLPPKPVGGTGLGPLYDESNFINEQTPLQSSSEQLHSIGMQTTTRKDLLARPIIDTTQHKPISNRLGVVKQKSNSTSSAPSSAHHHHHHHHHQEQQHTKLKSRPSYEHQRRGRRQHQETNTIPSATDSEEDELAEEEETANEEDDSLGSTQQDVPKSSAMTKKADGRHSKSRHQKQSSTLAASKKTSTLIGAKSDLQSEENQSTFTAADEKARQLLSELKLTEQANQVMEQQQQLIKQSQELIKLQQAQLEKQNELKKSTLTNSSSGQDSENSKQVQQQQQQQQQSVSEDELSESNITQEVEAKDQATSLVPKKPLTSKLSNETTASKKSITSKRASSPPLEVGDDEEEDQVNRAKTKRVNSSSSDRLRKLDNLDGLEEEDFDEDDEVNLGTDRKGRSRRQQVEASRGEIKKKASVGTSTDSGPPPPTRLPPVSASPLIHRHRDPLLSPTDTTDSDIDLATSHRRAQRQQHQMGLMRPTTSRPRSIVRRREPTGLPPSPLPVAAAIQLHQLQQQHLKNQPALLNSKSGTAASLGGVTALARNNPLSNFYLRSRSVTSSPNHLFERTNGGGGYSTDYNSNTNQRYRSLSPDTMSEHGGQMRRRRRLPEPPSNTVPLTPSMVRKMIQAQKAGSTSTGKLLTSLNAQSTLLANMHSTRNPSLDRLPNGTNRSLTATRTDPTYLFDPPQPLASSTGAKQSVSFSKTLGAPAQSTITPGSGLQNNPSLVSQLTYKPQQQISTSSNLRGTTAAATNNPAPSDLDRFLNFISSGNKTSGVVGGGAGNGSSAGAPLASSHQFTNVKETPELDKLISNLDDYYGLDSRRDRYKFSRGPLTSSLDATAGSSSYLTSSSLSPRFNPSSRTTNHIPTSSYLNRPSYRLGPSGLAPDSNPLRRNSDGEAMGSLFRPNDTQSQYYRHPSTLSSYHHHNHPPYSATTAPYSSQTVPKQYQTFAARDNTSSGDHHQPASTLRYPDSSMISQTSSQQPKPYSSLPYQSYSSHTAVQAPSHLAYPYTNERPLQMPTAFDQYPQFNHTSNLYSTTHHPQASAAAAAAVAVAHYGDQDRPRSTVPQGSLGKLDYFNQDQGAGRYGSRPGPEPGLRDPRHNRRINTNQSYMNSGDFNRSLEAPYLRDPQQSYDQTNLPSNNSISTSPYRSARGVVYGTTKPNAISIMDSAISNSFNNSENRLISGPMQGQSTSRQSRFAPFTKDDIINHGPKFNSIGYRFGTENQNKYVNEQQRAAIECLQSRYPHPYKRILLSKDPKDRIGNGIGVQIVGGQTLPNLYDKVNRCIISSGAFVSTVFQSSSAHLANDLREGDQIIEWNGVNLCNRSNDEVQQILLSQFSDEEVEIVYLNRDQFFAAYGTDLDINSNYTDRDQKFGLTGNEPTSQNDLFDQFARINRSGLEPKNPRYASEPFKESIRRKLSLSSISHKWTR